MAMNAIMNALPAFTSMFEGRTQGASSARQYQYNLALQQQQQQWNEYMYKHRYQFQREDLENAGINPLYGLGTAPSVTSGLNAVGMEDDNQAKQNAVQNALNTVGQAQEWSARQVQMKKMEQETRSEEVNTGLLQMEKVTKTLDQEYKTLQNEHLSTENKYQVKQIIANLKKTKSEITKNIAESTKAYADANKADAEASSAREYTKNLKTDRGRIEAESEKAQRSNQFEKKHPVIYDLGQTGKHIYELGQVGNGVIELAFNALNPFTSGQRGVNKARTEAIKQATQKASARKNATTGIK